MKKNLMHLPKNWANVTQVRVAPLVREFQPLTASLEKLSTALREIREMVSALLTPFESTLSRHFSLVTQYQAQLPDKKLLQAKLHEFYAANCGKGDGA